MCVECVLNVYVMNVCFIVECVCNGQQGLRTKHPPPLLGGYVCIASCLPSPVYPLPTVLWRGVLSCSVVSFVVVCCAVISSHLSSTYVSAPPGCSLSESCL